MPQLNWDAFARLPGGAEYNFEMLCRNLIRRHYGQYGKFAALAAQPGVEFHLKLHTRCSLGDSGRWYGWQCRWYDLPGGRTLGTTRRKKIEKAIVTTEKVLPELTDWVLWTRHPLTKGDQKWFYGLKTHMRLCLWTAAEVEEHLSGNALILRGTYFGELVLTPDELNNLHEKAVAPIRQRWQPEVHQIIDVERVLRRMLGETSTWDNLRKLADQLEGDAAAVGADLSDLTGSLAEATVKVVGFARDIATALSEAHTVIGRGDLDLLRQNLTTRSGLLNSEFVTLPRRLRASRKRAALAVTNLLADARRAQELLDEVEPSLSKRLIVVVADFGRGKTQLAAQLTAAVNSRPAGILLHGGDLRAGHSLDDIARYVVIQGSPVPSMEALVAAVDAAGQRAHQRLPITIDGLNEAEDPRNWRGLLASLHETLRQYPYVFVVCTLRTAFTGEALPPDVDRLEISDFGHDTVEAVRRSFAHYRINPADAELPLGLLSIPLTLRLFCEVTNPKREREVGVEAMPRSLTALFDRYLEQAAERIAELAPRTRRYYEQDIRTALDEIGLALWEENTRSLDLAALRRRLSDDGRPWNESIIRALEQEGILLRDPGDTSGAGRVAVLYDALAGHLVADRILTKHGSLSFEEWLKNPATATALVGPLSEQHPLAADIFRALVGLVPRRLHRKQLWQMLDEPLRTVALRGTAELEGAYLDAATVNALSTLVAQPPTESRDLLRQLWQTRSAPTHPLNAEFLDAVLRPMSVADRDLRWTEWVRRYSDELLTDLQRLEKRWRNRTERSSADRLRARWVMWTLTSTVRCLRDQATRAMYWFGRGDLAALFDLTIDALAINDPYISERLLGASYGVTMVHQLPEPKFARVLRAYLTRLRDALTGPSPIHPTSHWLARLYVQGTVTFALTYYPNAVPDGLEVEGRVLFAPGLSIDPIASDDPRASEVDSTLQMDFKNYTLGRLFDDRRNYDMDHAGHKAAVAHVRGTVWTFGWSKNKLGDIDRGLYSYRSRSERGTTERYGKKYGWVGFYTYAGVLDDCRQLPNKRLSDVDIDPTFPEQLPPASINLPIWVRQTPLNDQHWICRGKVAIPDELLYNANIDGHAGPWIAVQGDLGTDRQMLGRRVFGFLTALLVDAKQADRLVDLLNTRNHRGGWLFHEAPSDYYTFAGEIPWSPEFASSDTLDDFPQPYRRTFRVGNGSEIVTETLAHTYGWESHHSQLNTAGGALVPSQLLSKAFDLRGLPQSFNQVLPDGSFAVFSLGAPSGFSGHLLYVREDLLHSYAAGRKLIWFICGRRNLYPFPHPTPGWYSQALQKDADVWQHIRRGEELSRAFASKAQRRFRRSTRR